MISIVLPALLVLALLLSIAPLIGFAIAWRRFGSCARQRGTWIVLYYSTIAVILLIHFWAINAQLAVAHPGAFLGLLIAQIAIVLVGPLLGAEVIRAAGAASPLCEGCQYDLTGNTSGTCPECGRVLADRSAADSWWWRRWRRDAWPRVRIVWSLAFVLMFLLMGMRERGSSRYCPMCASSEYRYGYGLNIPLTGIAIISAPAKLDPGWGGRSALSAIVNPTGVCEHAWIELGSDVVGIGYFDLAMRDDPLWALDRIGSFDLKRYADTRPDLIAQCQQDLRAGRPCDALIQVADEDLTAELNSPEFQEKVRQMNARRQSSGAPADPPDDLELPTPPPE